MPSLSTWVSLENLLNALSATESPSKMMKNAFYFTIKAHSVLKMFKFLFWLFGLVEKRLDLKDKVNFKIYGIRALLTNTCIQTFPNISRSKDNQTMKFGQLLEYNIRNIFLGKSHTKCDGEAIPRPLSKNRNRTYLCVNSLKFYPISFYCMPSWAISQNIETKPQTICFYFTLSFFLKRGLELDSLPHFLHNFCRKIFFLLYTLLTEEISLSGCLYFVRYWAICALQLFVNQVVTSWILKLTLSF